MSTTQQQPDYDQRTERQKPEREKPDFALLAQQFTQWTPEDLEIIWERNDEIQTASDFRFFLYYCKQYQVDPVVGDVVATSRWNWAKQKSVLTPIVTIGVLRKRRAPECDGLDQFQFNYNGNVLVSASGSIYRKGCVKPFSATAFYKEYAGTDRKGNITSMWRDKSHIMLSKCLEAQLTRLAFFDLVGELLIDEETQARDHEAAPQTAETPLVVGVKPSPPKEPQSPPPSEPAPVPPPKEPEAPAPPDPKARIEAVRAKLGGNNPVVKGVVNDFFRGCFATNALPKKLELYAVPIEKLEAQTATPAGIKELLENPRECGARAMGHTPNPVEQFGVAQKWEPETMAMVRQIAKDREMQPEDMVAWFNTLELAKLTPADARAFFRMALVTRSAHLLLEAAAKRGVPPADLLREIETALGKPVDMVDQKELDETLDSLEKELSDGTLF